MACNGCGGRNKVPKKALTKALSSKALTEIQGVEGMVLLEYIGKSVGSQTWYGPATGKQYRFGLSSHKIQPVEPEDVQTGSNLKPGFLEIRESGKRIFRVITPKRIPNADETPHAAEAVAFDEEKPGDPSDFDAEKEAAQLLAKTETIDISVAAKKLAGELGVPFEDVITYVTGTGRDGKIIVKDIREYANA